MYASLPPDREKREEGEISRQRALDEVRHKIAIGLEQAERGEVFDGEEVFREILEKL